MATTWNPSDKSAGTTLSNGNLSAQVAGNDAVRSTTSHPSGKYGYTITGDVNSWAVGVKLADANLSTSSYHSGVLSYLSGVGWVFVGDSAPETDGANPSPAPTSSSVITVLLDADSSQAYFLLDGAPLFGADPSAGTGGKALTVPVLDAYYAAVAQSAFTGAPTSTLTADFSPTGLPSGWSAWDSAGGPTPETIQGTVSATGTGAAVFIAKAKAKASLTSSGTGSAAFTGKSKWKATLQAAGASSTSLVAQEKVKSIAALTASGAASVSFIGKAKAKATMTAQGSADSALEATMKVKAILTSGGSAVAELEAKARSKASMSAEGASDVHFYGKIKSASGGGQSSNPAPNLPMGFPITHA